MTERGKKEGLPILPIPEERALKASQTIMNAQGQNPAACFAYQNEQGETLYLYARFDYQDSAGQSQKIVLPYCWCQYPEGQEGWVCKLPDVFKNPEKANRPLLNLPEILKDKTKLIVIVEGEKKTLAAGHLFPEAVSTTSCSGAKSARKTDWSPLKDRRLMIWMDYDDSGKHYGKEVYALCQEAGAESIVFLDNTVFKTHAIVDGCLTPLETLRELPKGYDASDAVGEGWTESHLEDLKNRGALTFLSFEDIFKADLQEEKDQEIFERLSYLSPAEYDRVRKIEAEQLGITVNTLNAEVKKARQRAGKPRAQNQNTSFSKSSSETFDQKANPQERSRAPIPEDTRQHQEPSKRLLIGSDVELATSIREDLKTLYSHSLHAEGDFYRYGKTHWEAIEAHQLRSFVHDYDGAFYPTQEDKEGRVRLNKNRVDSTLHELAAILEQVTFFEEADIGINCANGFIQFNAHGRPSLETHSPDHRCRHTLPGTWKETPQPFTLPENSLLYKLLNGPFEGDADKADKINFLQEACGSAALGYGTKIRQPKAVILKGECAENGKSQILDLARGLLPDSAVSTLTATKMGDERHVPALIGKLLNASDELSSSSAISSDTFKAIVTGEPVSGREAYKKRVEFRPCAQHLFATNTLPYFQGGMDRGVQRRLVVITFNRVIPPEEQVEGIGRLIAQQESDLLLAWAVAGASRLVKNRNFTIPKSSKESLDDWLISADPVQAWINDWIDRDPIAYPVTTRAAYSHFKLRSEEEGFKLATLPSINGFVGRLKANAPKGIEYKRTKYDRCFYGMRLRNEGDPRQDSISHGEGENTDTLTDLQSASQKVTLADGKRGEVF